MGQIGGVRTRRRHSSSRGAVRSHQLGRCDRGVIDLRILAGYIGLETETEESLHQQNLQRILADHGLPHLIKDAVVSSSTPFSGPKLLAKTRNQIVHQDGGSELTTDKLGRADRIRSVTDMILPSPQPSAADPQTTPDTQNS